MMRFLALLIIGIPLADFAAARVFRLNNADFDDIRFIGESPIATLRFDRRARDLPIGIQAEVFSPFVPLGVRNSAKPATVLFNGSKRKAALVISRMQVGHADGP
jgi:uncharacterized protein (DUF608 family)